LVAANGRDRWNKSPFSGWLSIHDFSGIPIKCRYVNFQEFLSILKSILMQVRRENSEIAHISSFNRLAGAAGSEYISEIERTT